jgi:hypothetical protein
MLKARDFVEIDVDQPKLEILRLESLHRELTEQPKESRRRLTNEFLEIIEDCDTKPQIRGFACNILRARCVEFGIVSSQPVSRRLQDVLRREFLASKKIGILRLKYGTYLKEMGLLKFCFLMSLVLALLRIDYKNTQKLISRVTERIQNPEWKEDLNKLLTNERRKMRLPGQP